MLPRRITGSAPAMLTAAVVAGRYVLVGAGTAIVALVAIWGVVVVALLMPFGVGLPLVPVTVWLVRLFAGFERRRSAALLGVASTEAYRPLEGPLLARVHAAVADPSTRRDLTWMVVHGLVGTCLAVLALFLVVGGFKDVSLPLWWWAVPEAARTASIGYAVDSTAVAIPTFLLGLGQALLAFFLLPPLARWEARLTHRLLRPAPSTLLHQRVAELTATRAAAVEAHGAELRRIERDLHDGAQSRLVAVILQLGILERSLQRAQLETALPLVRNAQDAAVDALRDLRHVVRSIYPPILDERGLDGAVAALAARCAVPCSCDSGRIGRGPAAVEAAAYFVIAEALANVAKHSHARHASVRLSCAGDTLIVEVRDDGRGGADERSGSGLVGIRRRVAALDGRASLSSPPGGPTVIRVELPCES